MCYNNKVARKRDAQSLGSARSLTIEQQEIKVQAKAWCENLEISLKKKSWIYHGFETYSTKYKEPNKLEKLKVLTERFKYNLLESLILAQDERWRRA